jgi:magnesium and cobalt transporter
MNTPAAHHNDEPFDVPTPKPLAIRPQNGNGQTVHKQSFLVNLISFLFGTREDRELKEALAEVISDNHDNEESGQTALHQKTLIENVLKLKDLSAFDVMVPRADIVGIESGSTADDILQLLAQKQYSRLPVYNDNLDDVIGTIHIKDILAKTVTNEPFILRDLVRDVIVISPAMPVLDLLLMMRQQKRHMALVVDEYGGIDGLVTINDIVETIVGEINDEYESGQDGNIIEKPDGTILADGRVDIEVFEEKFGKVLTDEDREAVDTLAGLVITLAGRVPARGEVLSHASGIEFEVIDADPRRINRMRIRNLPSHVKAR